MAREKFNIEIMDGAKVFCDGVQCDVLYKDPFFICDGCVVEELFYKMLKNRNYDCNK